MDKEIEDTLEYFKKQCLGNMDIFKSQFGEDSVGYIFNNELLRNLNSIKQALTTKSKKEQAFDIIKEKNVNIGIVNVVGSLEQYNQTYVYDNMLNVKWCLTEEEFDLLKEVLKNE